MIDTAGPAELDYHSDKYDGWSLNQIIDELRGETLTRLKRGSMSLLLARRDLGGLLLAASRLVTSTAEQMHLFKRVVDLDYTDARRHMKVWMHWPRIKKMLQDRLESCLRRGVPFITPGYRRCLNLAGVVRKLGPATPVDPPPPPVVRGPLPTDVEALTEEVERLELQNRLEREKSVRLTVELDITKEELDELRTERKVEASPSGWAKVGGFIRSLLPRIGLSAPTRASTVEIRTGNCLNLIDQSDNVYDAIVTDPPYSISLHGYAWDSTGISFSPELWNSFFRVLKPGGYIALFAASRLYHRAAMACETAGFIVYPFLSWRFRDGLPKPNNLAELFDRDNVLDREIIGTRRGSGFTQANVDHGAQNRSHVAFAMHERHVSDEAKAWRGFYYGVNTMKPCLEPILLAQKPTSTVRMIDNIREWGTGALNIGALQDRYGVWPNTLFTHRKALKSDHQSDHPSVKPIPLMEDLCTLVCPVGGRILDPFAGTGSTAIAARNKGFDCVLIEENVTMEPVMRRRLAKPD